MKYFVQLIHYIYQMILLQSLYPDKIVEIAKQIKVTKDMVVETMAAFQTDPGRLSC